jgi:hypothetical protein
MISCFLEDEWKTAAISSRSISYCQTKNSLDPEWGARQVTNFNFNSFRANKVNFLNYYVEDTLKCASSSVLNYQG